MEQQILEILKRIESKVDENTKDIKDIKQKIDSVYEQTAELTEFRTETKMGMENIRKDISEFSNATMTNCYDIAKLRAIK